MGFSNSNAVSIKRQPKQSSFLFLARSLRYVGNVVSEDLRNPFAVGRAMDAVVSSDSAFNRWFALQFAVFHREWHDDLLTIEDSHSFVIALEDRALYFPISHLKDCTQPIEKIMEI